MQFSRLLYNYSRSDNTYYFKNLRASNLPLVALEAWVTYNRQSKEYIPQLRVIIILIMPANLWLLNKKEWK